MPDPFSTGTGTWEDDVPWVPEVVKVGGRAGPNTDPQSGDMAAVQVFGLLPDETFGVAFFSFPQSALAAGKALPLNLIGAVGYLMHFDPAIGEPTFLGYILDGTLEIEDGAPSDGAPVRATFDGILMGPGG